MRRHNAFIASGCPHATTTLYRCINLAEQLSRHGIASVVREWYSDDATSLTELRNHDLIVLHRVAASPRLGLEIARARARGALVLFDTDDVVFEPALTQWHRGVNRLSADDQQLYHEGVRRYLAMLEASDYALVSTEPLAELAERRGKRAFVHRNALGTEMWSIADRLFAGRAQQQSGDQVLIGYGSGTATHDVDFEQVTSALFTILLRHSNVHVCLVGPLATSSVLDAHGDRIIRRKTTSWQEWLSIASTFDINLAPLEPNNPFCRAKSEIKVVEAAALGVPTVASRIEPYEHVIVDGTNGLLAGDEQEWTTALTSLVANAARRRELGNAARLTAASRYSVEARTADLGRVLDSLRAETSATWFGKTTPLDSAAHGSSGPTSAARTRDDRPPKDADGLVLNWLIPEPFKGSGGHISIFRMIRYLSAFGHVSHVYTRAHGHSAPKIHHFVDAHFGETGATYHVLPARIVDADATIATFWPTAYEVAVLPPDTGRRYYLVQDFEPFFYPMGSEWIAAENSYRLGLHCLTLGRWLARRMREHYNAEADHFDFAIDPTIYVPATALRSDRPRIAFYARPSTPRRGYGLGTAALKLVKEARPDVEMMLFGADDLEPPGFQHTNLGILPETDLAALYSSCDVGLVLSLTNPSFVPLEMMACRCAVVDVESERVEGLLRHGDNAWLAEATPQALADAVLHLLADPPLRFRLVEQGYQYAYGLTWEHSARQLEKAFIRHAPPPDQRARLRRPPDAAANADASSVVTGNLADAPYGGPRTDLPESIPSQTFEVPMAGALSAGIDFIATFRHERRELRRLSARVLELAADQGIVAVLREVVPYLRFRLRGWEFRRRNR
jgi:glycosyltransferase involved in cell wall biosynthesis